MSDQNLSRRTAVEISFDGIDITGSIEPYFLSLSYVDNEEDEADSLQIQVQDRDQIWTEKWLNDAIETASTTKTQAQQNTKTAPAGYGLGGIPLAAPVVIEDVFNIPGMVWPAWMFAQGTVGAGQIAACGDNRLRMKASIVRQNWLADGVDIVLPCGEFELASVTASGPPDRITLKGTALPFSAPIRQTKKSKAWENYSLSGIANEIARANGMVCMYEAPSDPFYDRVEQTKTSDIQFLKKLCHDAGISLKATDRTLVLFDQAAYESKAAVFSIKRGSGSYISHKLNIGTADTQYASCRVSYVLPSGVCIAAVAKSADYNEDAKNNQQLEITAKVGSTAEAQTLAEKMLRMHNKYAKTATFTLPGNPDLVAGVTVTVENWGVWNGKYIIKQAKHTVNSSGYKTDIEMRRVLEGY